MEWASVSVERRSTPFRSVYLRVWTRPSTSTRCPFSIFPSRRRARSLKAETRCHSVSSPCSPLRRVKVSLVATVRFITENPLLSKWRTSGSRPTLPRTRERFICGSAVSGVRTISALTSVA